MLICAQDKKKEKNVNVIQTAVMFMGLYRLVRNLNYDVPRIRGH